jgi:hypothetical protein
MGYTVSGVHRRRPIHQHIGKEAVYVKPKNTQPVAKSTHPPPLPAKEEPVEALTSSWEHGPRGAEPEGELPCWMWVLARHLCICTLVFVFIPLEHASDP